MVSKPKHHCGHIVSSGIGTLPSSKVSGYRLNNIFCTSKAVGFENSLESPVAIRGLAIGAANLVRHAIGYDSKRIARLVMDDLHHRLVFVYNRILIAQTASGSDMTGENALRCYLK